MNGKRTTQIISSFVVIISFFVIIEVLANQITGVTGNQDENETLTLSLGDFTTLEFDDIVASSEVVFDTTNGTLVNNTNYTISNSAGTINITTAYHQGATGHISYTRASNVRGVSVTLLFFIMVIFAIAMLITVIERIKP